MKNWGDCSENCPVDVNSWSSDNTLTLKVTYNNLDLKNIMIAVKLLGIMGSSLLVIGLLVTGLGTYLVSAFEI